MMRHDESLLWEYAARELPSEDARLVQHHLTECPECQEKLTDVRTARGALAAVKGADFRFTYAKADAAIARVVEKKMAHAAFSRPWVLGLSGALVTAGLLLVAYGFWSKAPPAPLPELAEVEAPAPRPLPLAVERAAGLTVIGAQTRVLGNGAALASGDVLRTEAKGEATLRLPEGSRLKLGGGAQLSLTRADSDDVALQLERGHLAVAASHAQRKGFVVHTEGMMVTVVGTRFAVTSSRDGVEVAVAEGKVSVEPPVGLPQFVSAGQRVRFDSRWRSQRGSLTAAEKRELSALGESTADAVKPPTPVVPAHGGGTRAAAPATPTSASDLKSLVADAALELAPPPSRPADPAPAPSKPDMTGLEVPLLASPVESVGHPPAPSPTTPGDWAPLPAAKPASANASKLNDESPEESPDEVLQRADRSLSHGTCDRFLKQLDQLASDASRGPRAEKARIIRARCFDAQMRVRDAKEEYRRYLMQYPGGQYVDEARHIADE
ncbi:MAG: FecR domain-containing protein [Archangiaceae bacterium]|nr:FecR domain-containing protein [Archangiaceae bacterium]